MVRDFLFIQILTSLSLVACLPPSESTCMSTAAESLPLADTQSIVQGGYIQFADKACNATFDIISLSSESIRLRAYSSRHCRNENGLEIPKTFVHLYFNESPERSAGYIKNLPAREEFVERVSNYSAELKKMSLPKELEVVFLQAVRIPTHAEFDAVLAQQQPADSLDPVNRNPENLICLIEQISPRLPDVAGPRSDLCWSALEIGQYDLELSKSDISAEIFSFLAKKLNDKKRLKADYLGKNPKIAAFATEQQNELSTLKANLRFQNYARLAYLLSFDHCKISQASGGISSSICANQSKLIELVGNYLIEPDASGTAINIFDRLAREKDFEQPGISFSELKAGRRFTADKTPTTFAQADERSNRYSTNMYSVFRDQVAGFLRRMIERTKNSTSESDKSTLSASFVVSSNLRIRSGSGFSDLFFTQYPLTQIAKNPQSIQIATDTSGLRALEQTTHGITQFGTLRMGVPKATERVAFNKSDSGSLITLSGFVPLMVLNTVDDQGVSGGASVLVLPEAQAEEFPSVSKTSSGKSPSANSTGSRKNKIPATTACR